MKLLLHLIHFDENLEYIIKYALQVSIDGTDWHERYNGIITLKIICEHKREFLVDKKQYCRKIIECLVYSYKGNSQIIKSEVLLILTTFIAKLSNYAEILSALPQEVVDQIYKMQCDAGSVYESKIDKLIQQSLYSLSTPIVSSCSSANTKHTASAKDISVASKQIEQNYFHVDSSGFVFGVFPYELIKQLANISSTLVITVNNTNTKLNEDVYEERNDIFKQLYDTFMSKHTEKLFQQNANLFFKYILPYLNDKSTFIVHHTLKMLNTIIKETSGIYLLTNLNIAVGPIISTFKHQNVNIRKTAYSILTRLLMILPTSQMIPHIINSISNSHNSWTTLCECLKLMLHIFSNLSTIYNDIEWNGIYQNYDLNVFLEVLKLFDHPIAKVAADARKVVTYFADVVSGDKELFVKTLSYYVNNALYREMYELIVEGKVGVIRADKPVQRFDVGLERMVSEYKKKMPLAVAEAENEKRFLHWKVIENEERLQKEEARRLQGDLQEDEETIINKILDKQDGLMKKYQRYEFNNYNKSNINGSNNNNNSNLSEETKIARDRMEYYLHNNTFIPKVNVNEKSNAYFNSTNKLRQSISSKKRKK